jgi:hypothetical protein
MAKAGQADRQMGAGVTALTGSAQHWAEQQGCESLEGKNV